MYGGAEVDGATRPENSYGRIERNKIYIMVPGLTANYLDILDSVVLNAADLL